MQGAQAAFDIAQALPVGQLCKSHAIVPFHVNNQGLCAANTRRLKKRWFCPDSWATSRRFPGLCRLTNFNSFPFNSIDKRIRRGSFSSVPELIAAIMQYLENHYQNPQVFVWSASVEKILAKIAKCKETLEARRQVLTFLPGQQ